MRLYVTNDALTVIRPDAVPEGWAYPFLPAGVDWQLTSRPLSGKNAIDDILIAPTLRWVKDDKVLDLYVPGLDTAAFLAQSGLVLSLDKGGYVLSKRLSRVMRPYHDWDFLAFRS